MAADSVVEVNARPVPQEPMVRPFPPALLSFSDLAPKYIIVNVGISPQFGRVDTAHLVFPSIMSVDYIRVYQPKNAINIGCDPPNFPTADYIQT
jgi:hypothetical protein